MNKIQQFCSELQENLQTCILPYWMEKMVDPQGGFYGERDGNDCVVADAPKGAILNGRLLWSFSAAYRTTGKPEYLALATRAKGYIINHFYDREFGGIYWSVDAQGNPLDTKKQFYAMGFVIYGLSEYVRATGDREALEYAIRLFHDIEKHSRDRRLGGYVEATTREWGEIADMRLSDKDANEKKTMNTHLHIIEPYTNLYRVWRSAELRDALLHLMHLFLDVMEDGETHHLGLFFDERWNRHDGIRSYGHDIEASWLLMETALVLGDAGLLEKTKAHTALIVHAALEGRQPDGSMVYERHADGSVDCDRHWWVQAENVIGQVYLYKFHGEADAIDGAIESWNYIKHNLVDAEDGEWFWSRKADGGINRVDDKAGFWKCPYHNSRMCMEVCSVLSEGALSPFRFRPYLKSVLWGGEQIARFKGVVTNLHQIGESWEVSGVRGHESEVASGDDKGTTLPHLIDKYKGQLVGEAVYAKFGTTFPLLVKIIDAKRDLSLQVHPNDELAKQRHNSFGKTEMWYIIKADAGASIYAGLAQPMTPQSYEQRIADNTIMDVVARHESHAGDVFFLPAGRIHAIGAGNLLAEIQQTSDITYRVYDFNRLDANGKPRELHTELAKDAIDYHVYDNYLTDYDRNSRGDVDLVNCAYFDVRRVLVDGSDDVDCSRDSFMVVMCLDGEARITCDNATTVTLLRGATVLVPACVQSFHVEGKACLLTATV